MCLERFWWNDWHFSVAVAEKDKIMHIFNDGCFTEKPCRRKHMLYLSITVVVRSSEAALQAEAKRWLGERDIAVPVKGKKNYRFCGREEFSQMFADQVVDRKLGTFTGEVPVNPPEAALKMWPVNAAVKTFFA